MTTTVILGNTKPVYKKAYSVEIRERVVDERGKVTGKSVNSTTFQVRDIEGSSELMKIKERLMAALQ